MQIELKPCPFCGGAAKQGYGICGGWTPQCSVCGVGHDSVDSWNKRVRESKPLDGLTDARLDLIAGEIWMAATRGGYSISDISEHFKRLIRPYLKTSRCTASKPEERIDEKALRIAWSESPPGIDNENALRETILFYEANRTLPVREYVERVLSPEAVERVATAISKACDDDVYAIAKAAIAAFLEGDAFEGMCNQEAAKPKVDPSDLTSLARAQRPSPTTTLDELSERLRVLDEIEYFAPAGEWDSEMIVCRYTDYAKLACLAYEILKIARLPVRQYAALGEYETITAIKLMADAMEKGAHYYGPNHSQISGEKAILAERGLRELLEQYEIRRKL